MQDIAQTCRLLHVALDQMQYHAACTTTTLRVIVKQNIVMTVLVCACQIPLLKFCHMGGVDKPRAALPTVRMSFDRHSHQRYRGNVRHCQSEDQKVGQHNLTRLYETSEGTTPLSWSALSCRKYLLNTSMTPSVSPACKIKTTAPTRNVYVTKRKRPINSR